MKPFLIINNNIKMKKPPTLAKPRINGFKISLPSPL